MNVHKTIGHAYSPLLSLALLMLGAGFMMTFTSLRLDIEGYSPSVIGYVQAAYFGGFFAGALIIETLLKRVKHIRSFAIFASLATALMCLQGIWVEPLFWTAIRFLSGLSIAALYVVIESWLLTTTPQAKRGTILSFYMIALYSSQTLSQFFLKFVSISSMEAFLITALLSALSIIPVSFTNAISPHVGNGSRVSLLRILKLSPLGFIGCIFSGLVLSSIYSFAPTYAQDTFISVPLLVGSTIAGGFLLQWPIGHLSDLFDRRKVLVILSFTTLLPCLGIIFTRGHEIPIYILSFFLGGLTFTINPISVTQVCDRFHPDHITSLTGILLVAYSIGAICGPLIAPFFIEQLYPFGLYIYIGSVCLILGLLGLFALWKWPGIPKIGDQTKFLPSPPESLATPNRDPPKEKNPT